MNKIFQIVCVLIFFLSFTYFFGDDYWDFHEWEKHKQVFQEQVSQTSQTVNLDEVPDYKWDIDLWSTPSKELLQKLVQEIDAAQREVLVEVYIFTERDLRDALIRAHKRWITVQILLENNPYKAPYLNDNHYEAFREAWLDVKWSDPLNYSLNHSKLLIIDERAYVATWNFSYATFTKNRDIFLELRDETLVWKLKELFALDFGHELSGVFDESLLISPYSSRWKIEWLIERAEESIDFYFPYMTDDGLEQAFSNQVKQGIRLRGIMWNDYISENTEDVKRLKQIWWNIFPMKSPKLHAKAILVDQKYLYIGSINFSTYSLDENREMWLIITNPEIISEFQDIFEWDLWFSK